jgi:MarR family transcriptional regulator, lower aerobic nicotinate degradation pathway regulator
MRDKAGHLLRRAAQRNLLLFAEAAREFDITHPQYIILLGLALHPGVDQNGLAEAVDLDRWTTGDVVSRLERRGLLTREVDSADRRVRRLHLTPAGAALVQAMEGAGAQVHERLLAPLDAAERGELMRLLRKLLGVEG